MENKKQIIIIVFALIMGIGAVVITKEAIKNDRQTLKEEISVRTSRAIDAKVNPEFQKVHQGLSQIASSSKQDAQALKGELQRISTQQAKSEKKLQNMIKKEMAKSKVVKAVSTPSLALKTPVGKRAYTILIDSLAAVGGLINAGDFVDVLTEITPPKMEESDPVTVTLFQNIQVLAVGPQVEPTGNYAEQQRARSLKVTFALDPEQTGLIAFVSKHGNFRLVLRSPKERSYQMLTAPTWERLSEYLEDQGIKIPVPAKSRPIDEDADLESIEVEEVQPYIQIFRAGEEL